MPPGLHRLIAWPRWALVACAVTWGLAPPARAKPLAEVISEVLKKDWKDEEHQTWELTPNNALDQVVHTPAASWGEIDVGRTEYGSAGTPGYVSSVANYDDIRRCAVDGKTSKTKKSVTTTSDFSDDLLDESDPDEEDSDDKVFTCRQGATCQRFDIWRRKPSDR